MEYSRFPASFGFVYQRIIKPLFFSMDPEFVHTLMVHTGQHVGDYAISRKVLSLLLEYEHESLNQTVAGIHFRNPVGLAAGFDYEARLSQILKSVGFGFQSVGTITNSAYEGNPKPRLGRLPRSQSLMVNKGYKNLGAAVTIKNLSSLQFPIPLGVSIGRTNSRSAMSQSQSLKDVVHAFIAFEKSNLDHSYYELNISCPNLYGSVSFYPKKHLTDLLRAINELAIKRPIFVKMPIDKTDNETLAMFETIAKHKLAGVIIGNLQKDRHNPALVAEEVRKFSVGNFSGLPTRARSNELISLCYRHFSMQLIIIGCGGVFGVNDAYEKIQRGASLIQLITGMIYNGPQVISQINMGLVRRMKKDGFNAIDEVVGTYE